MPLAGLTPLAEQWFDEIRTLSFDGVGVTRESYGDSETAAARRLAEHAEREGIAVRTDRAANLIFSLPDADPHAPAIWVGSHLDSVPHGGNYDGLAGVVAGLLCLVAQRRAGRASPRPLNVIALRGEESAWFGKAYVGSSALFGRLKPADLAMKHRSNGRTLADCMAAAGVDVDAVRAQKPLFDARRAHAYLELHIEQGPVMVARGLPVAVVSGIRGNVRHNSISCIGEAGHSGAVPRNLRHDAIFAVAELITRLDEHWRRLLERDIDLVVTTGIVSTDQDEHSISRIPGQVHFSFEARSESAETLDVFHELLIAECNSISRERGVRFDFDRRLASAPARMDPALRAALADACARLDVPFATLPSGAGHDAALFANAGVPSGMLFVRNDHGSHNPHEAMSIDDFMLGAGVLAETISRL
ncbi:hydantoinase/carbamoylase family amidase [Burkholderia oklahomensis]|uniref:hydantoinase/carbamoylase family amidase n=1 Tax=Burkholderia oklahomensis TaxID=342113 RepID=UPI0002FEF9C5|nr:hydantoinase/carbamoylase family amidase [Burkholderia oklahomensis]AJX35298.1 amidase, hydantoinase/carbamoylase family protein [Burkholderia oklahomensis C6786]AOI50246.1 Zn-dependent hydrolase [Burkholderia oklahomensis C6786]KUY60915.1 Zn-dependent hydrolase [Burkholderia oklahomensis C6786]MBI0362428.1 hydantoinase/carbamoylase family amidase [Burkholderia oklahomensis]